MGMTKNLTSTQSVFPPHEQWRQRPLAMLQISHHLYICLVRPCAVMRSVADTSNGQPHGGRNFCANRQSESITNNEQCTHDATQHTPIHTSIPTPLIFQVFRPLVEALSRYPVETNEPGKQHQSSPLPHKRQQQQSNEAHTTVLWQALDPHTTLQERLAISLLEHSCRDLGTTDFGSATQIGALQVRPLCRERDTTSNGCIPQLTGTSAQHQMGLAISHQTRAMA